jgi:hypothetical protein
MRDVPEDLLTEDPDAIADLEAEIAAEVGVEPSEVIVDVPERPQMKESTSRVVVNGEIRALEEQSTLVTALRAAQKDQWRLGVYAPEDVTDQVGHAASRVLGLDIDGALVSDVRPGRYVPLDEFQK